MEVTVTYDVAAPMRDGTVLRADVYRPSGEGPWPALLTRTPYDKSDHETGLWFDPLRAARGGFLVVVQDTRGRFASEGEWMPFVHERTDGHDSVRWVASLPGSNGAVGMFGDSYVGNTQWQAAIGGPPALRAIAPGLTWADPLDGLFARDGAVELGLTLPWTLQTAIGWLRRLEIDEIERRRRLEAIIADYDSLLRDGYGDLPVTSMDLLVRHGAPDLGGISALSDPTIAAPATVRGHHAEVSAASLNIGGWYDVALQGTLENFKAMRSLGRPSRLVVGPWTHQSFGDPIGELGYGARSARLGAPSHPEGDLTDLQLAWFSRHLTDAPGDAGSREEETAAVRIFVMGADRWRDEEDWPPSRARSERLYLHHGGLLSHASPASGAPPSEFVYDPGHPVPTIGGPLVMAPAYPAGPLDQRRVEERQDVLCFTTETLQQAVEVTGELRLCLAVESSATATDWVARLCDVHPDGRSFNVTDGIVRLAEGANRLHRIEIDFWSTSILFGAGHRMRLQVSSSCFPRWDRNLNTGDQGSTRMQAATQRLHHDADAASFLELPILE